MFIIFGRFKERDSSFNCGIIKTEVFIETSVLLNASTNVLKTYLGGIISIITVRL
jgi:hypothetical protein